MKTYKILTMVHYFKRSHPSVSPSKASSLTDEELWCVNKEADSVLNKKASGSDKCHRKYNDYTPEERARIGKYAVKNRPTRAVQHCSRIFGKSIPETTANRWRSEYLLKITAEIEKEKEEKPVSQVLALPKLSQGIPLLLGHGVDRAVQRFVESIRKIGGLVNTAIVMAAA